MMFDRLDQVRTSDTSNHGLIMFLVMVLMVLAVLIGVRYLNQNQPDELDSNIALIKSRYAKGEIDKKEYDQLLKDLSA